MIALGSNCIEHLTEGEKMNYCIGCEEQDCEYIICEECGCRMKEEDALRHMGKTVCQACADSTP